MTLSRNPHSQVLTPQGDPGFPPLPQTPPREGVSALGVLGSVLPRRDHSHLGTAPQPDSQILQPKFNFQAFLTLEGERSKLETVRGEGERERKRERERESVCVCVCESPTHLGYSPSSEESYCPPSLDCSKNPALGLGAKTEAGTRLPSSSWLTEPLGLPDHSLEKRDVNLVTLQSSPSMGQGPPQPCTQPYLRAQREALTPGLPSPQGPHVK